MPHHSADYIFIFIGIIEPIMVTVEPQWLEHLWDHGKLFETWVVRATEG